MAQQAGPRIYCCCKCQNRVSLHEDVVSKAFQDQGTEVVHKLLATSSASRPRSPSIRDPDMSESRFSTLISSDNFRVPTGSNFFQGRHGRGFLFSHAMNIDLGPKEDRHLMTGLHTVADVYCKECREVLGWKYERAYEETQKYKEGKFILEKSKIVKEDW